MPFPAFTSSFTSHFQIVLVQTNMLQKSQHQEEYYCSTNICKSRFGSLEAVTTRDQPRWGYLRQEEQNCRVALVQSLSLDIAHTGHKRL